MTKKSTKRFIALVITLVMTSSFALPTFAANETQLETPMLSQNSGSPGAAGTGATSRDISWDPIEGAVSYTLYVFNSLENARAGQGAVARTSIEQSDERIVLDFRTLTFENLIEGKSVIHPPEVVNDASFVRGLRTTGNLKPGAYWIRLQAIAENPVNNSELSELPLNRQLAVLELEQLPIVIAMGPSEGRQLIEENFDKIGDGLRLVDVRPNVPDTNLFYEYWTEGWIRFFDERLVNIQQAIQISSVNPEFMTDEEIFEALPDKDAIILTL